MQRYACLAVMVVLAGRGAPVISQAPNRQPPVEFFATLGLTADDVAAIDFGACRSRGGCSQY
jgi:hypothetical protein